MCFSAEADVAAGIGIGVVGVDALRHARQGREIPLASLPALFAAHQLSEAFVWWDLGGEVSASTGRVALWVYTAFAYVVLPVLIPVAVLAVETDANRRRLLAGLTGVGMAVAVAYLHAMVRGPIGVADVGHRLAYEVPVGLSGLPAAAYIVAGCGALLASGHRSIVLFGVGNLVAVAILTWVATEGVASLWCLWAAVTSIAIVIHLRGTKSAGGKGPPEHARRRGERARLNIASPG